MVIPRALDDLLVERLLEVEDDSGRLNKLLFAFLTDRASDYVFRSVIEKSPQVFDRSAWASLYAAHDPKVNFYARAYSIGCLPPDRRIAMAGRLELICSTIWILQSLPTNAFLNCSHHQHCCNSMLG